MSLTFLFSEDNVDPGKKKKQKGSKKDAKKGGKSKTDAEKKEPAMSQEEAAVVIQKQFRGYQVRKQMGHKEKSKPDKLQEETALFIRQYCRKWKAKSMFQVLLLYRAARHQDLVYFSQQVHLYNQNAMSTIANTAIAVKMNHIDPGSRATIELGKPQPTVWKLPFRLADLNFFDTSFMCDPAAPMREDLDDDQESWDEPLRRDFLIYGKKHVRDVQVQTCSSPFNEQHDYGNEANSLSQTPFCRDPDELLKPSELLQQRRYGTPFRGASPVNSEVGGYKSGISKFNEKPNRGIMFDQPRPYQKTITTPKRFAPKPPSPTFSQSSYNDNEGSSYDTENNVLSSQSWNQTSSSPTNERFGLSSGVRRNNNPIAEMEMRGRRQSNAEETDEPPFNFQAMLRKTNYKRPSLKRDAGSYGHNQMYNEENSNFASPRRNNVVFNSSPQDINRNRSPSPTPSFGSETQGFQSPYQKKKSPEINFSNRNETSPDTMTELAPGIVIQGQVADL